MKTTTTLRVTEGHPYQHIVTISKIKKKLINPIRSLDSMLRSMALAESQSVIHSQPLFCNEYPTPIITTAKLSCPN